MNLNSLVGQIYKTEMEFYDLLLAEVEDGLEKYVLTFCSDQ